MLITIPEDSSTVNSRDHYHQPLSHSLSAPVRCVSCESQGRIRIVRLFRPQCGSYGFHLRGGLEHETGFFISHVEERSEAYAQGLRTGDQLVRVNNMNVNHSFHKEVASIVKNSSEVVLEVKSSGIIPVKDNPQDQLSWMSVNNKTRQLTLSTDSQPTSLKSISSSSSSSSCSLSSSLTYVSMKGAGKGTIGCSICKGPEDKPGIFVQKIHTGGIADEAGLRTGDQIFSCNGKSFLDVEFQEAVHHMKSGHCLKLEVLRGAGMELVAGESSGYNSSISSESDEISENECKERRYISSSRTITRVNSLYLDSNRDWKEIEAEWAEAEVSEKRSKLAVYNSKDYKMFTSKSLLNLSPSPAKKTGSLKPSTAFKTKVERQPASIYRPQSMTNISLLNKKENFKIAFQTTDDLHVNKIIIPPPPKDERSAIMRLELLSASSTLTKNSTVSSSITGLGSQVVSPPIIYSCGSESSQKKRNISRPIVKIQEMKSLTHKLPTKSLKLEQKSTHAMRLNRGRNPPKECPTINAEDPDSNYLCSKICISSGTGKFTSKVIIRSCPPTPPPRATSTRLTQERHQCSHRRRLNSQQLSYSPPSSISSGSSREYPKCDHNFNRQLSSGSLSLSSDESGTWEETVDPFATGYSSINSRTIPSPPKKHPTLTREAKPAIKPIPPPPPPPPPHSNQNSIPPCPPIPPPPPLLSAVTKLSDSGSSSTNMSLNAAISKEIKARQEQDSNGLKDVRNAKNEQQRKSLPSDPNKQQHEKLMDEFKKAHALMFSKKNKEITSEDTDDSAQ